VLFEHSCFILMPRVYTAGYMLYKLYPLVAVNMFLVSAPATKLSVAGYKGIQVDRDINE